MSSETKFFENFKDYYIALIIIFYRIWKFNMLRIR